METPYERLSASEFLLTTSDTRHLDLTRIDVPIEELALTPKLKTVSTLSLSDLGLSDSELLALVEAGGLASLAWLDLSGNSLISESGVRGLACGISEGLVGNLDWLDLRGTNFDATPYVNGSRWCMAPAALLLVGELGYQDWMTLGSKDPALSEIEHLAPEERELPPNRFVSQKQVGHGVGSDGSTQTPS